MNKRRSIFSPPLNDPVWIKGSGHTSELPFLFPVIPLQDESPDDRAISIAMMKYWSNFAKTGVVMF